jgi:sugar transferase (PEP-CTERM/EpsH1 system associated)
MKVLLLTHLLSYSRRQTNRIRAFNWLKYLSQRHEIFLVSFVDSAEEMAHLEELKKYCCGIEVVLRRPRRGLLCRLANIFQGAPYFILTQFTSPEMQAKINQVLRENKFDLIHVYSLAMAQYVCKVRGVGKILDAGDCITRHYLQEWMSPISLRDRVSSFIDWAKMRNYEPKMFFGFEKSILVNPIDREVISKKNPGLSIEVIPYGVDLEYFQPQDVEEDFPSLIFTAGMHYLPNTDAIVHFCLHILPRIEKKYPQVKLYILGEKSCQKLNRLAEKKKNIILVGFVEDIRNLMAKASVFICPMRLGTGNKTKVLEAMAMAKAVVSTSIGAEGYNLVSGKEILIADDPENFSGAVLRLLDDKRLRGSLGVNARKKAEEEHNFEALAQKMDAIYSAVGRKG